MTQSPQNRKKRAEAVEKLLRHVDLLCVCLWYVTTYQSLDASNRPTAPPCALSTYQSLDASNGLDSQLLRAACSASSPPLPSRSTQNTSACMCLCSQCKSRHVPHTLQYYEPVPAIPLNNAAAALKAREVEEEAAVRAALTRLVRGAAQIFGCIHVVRI